MNIPLHVEVAVSLGWTDIKESGTAFTGVDPQTGTEKLVPRFDRWCFCGPLVDAYKISITKDEYYEASPGWYAFPAFAESRGVSNHRGAGKSATEAVCRLIVDLHRSGRLKAA